jgi:hypothetical protein
MKDTSTNLRDDTFHVMEEGFEIRVITPRIDGTIWMASDCVQCDGIAILTIQPCRLSGSGSSPPRSGRAATECALAAHANEAYKTIVLVAEYDNINHADVQIPDHGRQIESAPRPVQRLNIYSSAWRNFVRGCSRAVGKYVQALELRLLVLGRFPS